MKSQHCPQKLSVFLLFVSVVILALSSPAFAQSTKGSLIGRAVDGENAVLPGAKVQVQPGNASAVTDQRGEFTVIDLTPGTYKVTVSYVGFLPFTAEVKVWPVRPFT